MKADFYCLTEKKNITTEVTGKRKTANGRYQILGETKEGKTLAKFVSEKDYNSTYKSIKAAK